MSRYMGDSMASNSSVGSFRNSRVHASVHQHELQVSSHFHRMSEKASMSMRIRDAPSFFVEPVEAPPHRWPTVIVLICGAVIAVAYAVYQLPLYRDHISYSMHAWFGAHRDDVKRVWIGGHPEVVTLCYVALTIGIPTMLGGMVFAATMRMSPVLRSTGRLHAFVRFMRRNICDHAFNLSHAEGLMLLAFFGLHAIWFVAVFTQEYATEKHNAPQDATVRALGTTLGFNLLLCMSLQALPAIRNCFWMLALRVDYMRALQYHKWIGYLATFVAIEHSVPIYKQWAADRTIMKHLVPCLTCDFSVAANRQQLRESAGHLALVCLVIMCITSIGPVRRRWYEVFYYSHYLSVVLFIALSLHLPDFVAWMYPPVCLFMMHRVTSRTQRNVPVDVVDMEAIPGNITRIVLRRHLGEAGHYYAGQFLYLCVPLISRTQWHPFSLSSSPIEMDDTITVHVKAVGDWTKQLYAIAIQSREERKVPLIYVDGFYGSVWDEYLRYPALVFVTGGIGATPCISIIGRILSSMRNGDEATKHTVVYWHWSAHDVAVFHEFEPLLDAIEQFDPAHTRVQVRLFFTGKSDGVTRVTIPDEVQLKPLDDTSMVPTRPYFQSVRPVHYQLLLYAVTFLVSLGVMFVMRFYQPFLGKDSKYWAMQRLMECVLLLVSAAAGWIVTRIESKPRAMNRLNRMLVQVRSEAMLESDAMSISSWAQPQKPSASFNEVTFMHPVTHARMSVLSFLESVVEEQSRVRDLVQTGIGAWVSGPRELSRAVEIASASFAGIFDLHREEFRM